MNIANEPIEVSELRNNIVALARALKQSARSDDESWTNLMILGLIERSNGKITPSDIGAVLEIRSSNLASLLKNLAQRKLIIRVADEDDKRKILLGITDSGLNLVRTKRQKRDLWLQEAMQCLSQEEQTQLFEAGKLIKRIIDSKLEQG
ncbi:MarR family winged helix-turn-helix transcriptional regulator [Commensalibacter communis]|uniref:MarR family winged helix-turn-helix transcriptional regulator n=1 Tax=Commensalibacter communis TaxID=2972786 RepID=UPI0022FF94A8|nr:MarR family transcriptional regulator [Commensalibacter communis]CAI3957846.1 DNA-binding transcriptional regulator [Commensalibacter communis]CAI3958595.1 DNA-binding transcriptional regulator [Commensalibacter communis]